MRWTSWAALVLFMPTSPLAQPEVGARAFAADLEAARMSIEDLGFRFVGRDVHAGGTAFQDVGTALEYRRIRRLAVRRFAGTAQGGEVPLCIMRGTFRECDPAIGCMPFIVDGREMSQAQVATLAPEQMSAVTELMRREAMRLLGSIGQRGAVLLCY